MHARCSCPLNSHALVNFFLRTPCMQEEKKIKSQTHILRSYVSFFIHFILSFRACSTLWSYLAFNWNSIDQLQFLSEFIFCFAYFLFILIFVQFFSSFFLFARVILC